MTIKLVAHRGYCTAYPENTLEAIHAALVCGAKAVEFDVQMTTDHIPVVCHDEDMKRTAGVSRCILTSRYDELEKLSVGEPERFGQKFSQSQLPTLEQIRDLLLGWPDVLVFVELKVDSFQTFGSNTVLNSVIDILQPILSRCVFISYDLESLLVSRTITSLRIGWILGGWIEASHQQALKHHPEFLLINYQRVPEKETLWQGPWQWAMYETSEIEQARRLFERGVDWVETNDICPMVKAMLVDS